MEKMKITIVIQLNKKLSLSLSPHKEHFTDEFGRISFTEYLSDKTISFYKHVINARRQNPLMTYEDLSKVLKVHSSRVSKVKEILDYLTTSKEALEVSIEVWSELARRGCLKGNLSYEVFSKINGIKNNCPLCAYTDITCNICPLQHCNRDDSLYSLWQNACTISLKRLHAQKIVDTTQKYLDTHYGGKK